MQQNTIERSHSPTLVDTESIPENDLASTVGSLSNSNPSLNSRPSSINFSLQTKEELIHLVQELQSELTSLVRNYTGDKERLRISIQNLEDQNSIFGSNKNSTLGGTGGGNMQQIASLRQTLNQVMQQNNALRSKLQKIHIDSQIDDLPQVSTCIFVITYIRTILPSLEP